MLSAAKAMRLLFISALPGAAGIALMLDASGASAGGGWPKMSPGLAAPQFIGIGPGCQSLRPSLASDLEAEVERACEEIAEAVLGHLEEKMPALTCLSLYGELLHDQKKGPWLAKTRAQEAIMAFVKRYADDRVIQMRTVFLIGGSYGVPPAVTVRTSQLGGFTHLFNLIKHFDSDLELQMQTWRALSDPSYTPAGARAIANEGGPYEGIHFMVQQMKAHPDGHQAVGPSDHLDLLYEIMQVSAGTLTMNGAEYAPIFIREGFLGQIVHSMEVEHDLRGTQDVACKCMSRLTAEVPSAAVDLMDKGAVLLMKRAMDRFRDYDATPFCVGHTLGNEYPVVPFCTETLMSMVAADPKKAQALMRAADMGETLSQVRPDLLSGQTLLGGVLQGEHVRSHVRRLLQIIRE